MEAIFTWMSEHTLIVMLTLGTVFSFLWLYKFQHKIPIKWWQSILISIAHTLIGVVCVSVFAVIEAFDLSAFGATSLFGGVFLMPIAYYFGAKIFKQKVSDVFDVFTICIIGTLMFARINCLLRGCCRGAVIPGTDGLLWPTRELEVILYVVLIVFLSKKIRLGNTNGEIYPLYMAVYGIFRFITESFRYADSPLGIIHMGHIWAIISLGIGFSIYAEIKNKQNSKKKVRR